MASIDKLSVRGIRAFSPEDEEQVISFCFPLTIIVGSNGCGKTTIIEALKYAVTGSLPPGNKSGQAFVHDPKSVGTTQVKAAVKLRFNNRAGKTMVVVRSMELTQKKTNMQFKQLDGILRTTDERGNKVSLSHKCTELDKQIPQMLGVSKAVLEHVVFCHQEDSSWPLMEGAVLKKRFDDIFDSTRYVKALEAIKDTRKHFYNKVKDLKADLAELSGHKHAAMGFRQELDKCRQKLSEYHDEKKDFDDKIAQEKEKCKEWSEKVQADEEIQYRMEDKMSELEKMRVRIEEKREGLTEDLSSDKGIDVQIDELQQMLRQFDREMQSDLRDLSHSKARVDQIKADIEKAKDKKFGLSEEKGQLSAEKKQYDNSLMKRVECMEELATKYGLELTFTQSQQTDVMSTQQSRMSFGSALGDDAMSQNTASTIHLTAEDLEAFSRSVENKRNDLLRDLEEKRKECREADDSIQTELSDLKAKITTIETDLNRINADRSSAQKELSSLPRTNSRMRKSEIDEAKRAAERYAKIRNDLNNDSRRDSIPKEISEKESKIFKIKADIDELNSALRELRKCAEEQNNIDILQRQVQQDLELIDEMKEENDFLLKRFQIRVPDVDAEDCTTVNNAMDSILDDVTDKLDKCTRDFDKASDDQKKNANKLSKLSALVSHKRDLLAKRKEQQNVLNADGRGVQKIKAVVKSARNFEREVFGETQVALNMDPQNLLQYFTVRIGEANAEEGVSPETTSKIIKKLKKMAKVKDQFGETQKITCPCCARDLVGQEINVFQEKMDNLADPIDSPIIKTDEKVAKQTRSAIKNYENWRNLISRNITDWLDYQRFTDEIEGLKPALDREEKEYEKLKAIDDQLQETVQSCKDEQVELQQMQDLARRLRDEIGKITNKKSQISTRKEELKLIAPRASGKDLHDTEKEVNAKMEEKDSLLNQISRLNKDASELNQSINQANISATRAEKVVREKEMAFKHEQEAAAKKVELNESIASFKEQEAKLHGQIGPIRQKAKVKESEKLRLRSTTEAEIEKRSKLCTEFDTEAEKIDAITKEIEGFKSSGKFERLQNIDSDINNLSGDIQERQDQIDQMGPKLKALQGRVDDQGAHRKNVERNIELLEIISQEANLRTDMEKLQRKVHELDIDSIKVKLAEAQRNIRKYESEKTRREGSEDSLKSRQRDLQRKLKTSEYKDIDERHRKKMIETETSNLAVSDLDLYYGALDKALLRYHGIKIQEINKIIKELWTLTYRGEDITNIRLTSDQESNSRSTRSYNYRVVMTKGTTELDMRGRCSAGQRVLASIVIRLALAETFCLNCGVMALDEPTTNLDYANKRGLAIALAQIIAHRAAQDNFQLVIITHDEQFVSMMKNELSTHTGFDMPERYFSVSREESNDGCYYSKIHCIDWDEL